MSNEIVRSEYTLMIDMDVPVYAYYEKMMAYCTGFSTRSTFGAISFESLFYKETRFNDVRFNPFRHWVDIRTNPDNGYQQRSGAYKSPGYDGKYKQTVGLFFCGKLTPTLVDLIKERAYAFATLCNFNIKGFRMVEEKVTVVTKIDVELVSEKVL